MATFTNRATLTYRGGTTASNTVTGTLNQTLTLTKQALTDTYEGASRLVYVLALTNTGGAVSNLTLTDTLGGYEFEETTLYPLTLVEGSLLYYVNGVPTEAPTVTQGPPLSFSGISLPADSNALLIYEVEVNEFAPITEGSTVVNTATLTGPVSDSVTASETVMASASPNLTITKSLTPQSVGSDGALTYTFVIENSGTTEAVATDDIVVRDLFDPILTITEVTLDGVALTEGEGYTYDEASGEFLTVPSTITVPAATVERNPDGSYTVIPGRTVLTVSGRI